MGRLPAATIFVALAACHDGRLFDDDDVAALRTQVLANVAKSPRDCAGPDVVALSTPDKDCETNCTAIDYGRRSNEEADRRCAERLAMFVRHAKDGCSPAQAGSTVAYDFGREMWSTHVAHMLRRRAFVLPDTYDALEELLDAVGVMHSLRRGYVSVLTMSMSVVSEQKLLEAARQLLDHAQLFGPQRDELIGRVDALLENEPPILDALLGEFRGTALEQGAGPFRSGPGVELAHHLADNLALMMAVGLEREAFAAKFCAGSIAECRAAIASSPDEVDDAEALDRAAARYRVLPSEGARQHFKRALIRDHSGLRWFTRYVDLRAIGVTRLAALRMLLDTMRTHRCPAPFVPPQLGSAVRVEANGDGVDVLPPAWVAEQKAVHIRCP